MRPVEWRLGLGDGSGQDITDMTSLRTVEALVESSVAALAGIVLAACKPAPMLQNHAVASATVSAAPGGDAARTQRLARSNVVPAPGVSARVLTIGCSKGNLTACALDQRLPGAFRPDAGGDDANPSSP